MDVQTLQGQVADTHRRLDEAGEKLDRALGAKFEEWEQKLAAVAAVQSGPPETEARVAKLEGLVATMGEMLEK